MLIEAQNTQLWVVKKYSKVQKEIPSKIIFVSMWIIQFGLVM